MFRIGIEEIEEITKVIESKQLFKVNGGELQESQNLETELRAKFGVPYTLAMTSGHAALTSALIGMGIGPGDQVIVPAYTYIATAIAVVAAGAIPEESLSIMGCGTSQPMVSMSTAQGQAMNKRIEFVVLP